MSNLETLKQEWDVIYAYSRKDALNDGVLVDISQLAREAGYKYPVAITAEVQGMIEQAVSNAKCYNDYTGVLWDIIWMSKFPTKKIDATQHLFSVIITGVGRSKTQTLKVVCHPGDDAEPVITIMLPEQD